VACIFISVIETERLVVVTVTTTTTTTTTVLWPFIQYYPGVLVPEETLTHPPS